MITARKEDGDLNTKQCFWWLSDWRMCPTHTIAVMFEIYERLLPTRLYAIHKTQAKPNSDPTCRLCGTAPESMAHVLFACPALAQTKYLARHYAVLKVLFFDIMEDLGLIEASPPWYSPTKPQRYIRERMHRYTGTSQPTESTKISGSTELTRG